MAQWVKTVAVKADCLNLIPRAHMVEGQDEFCKVVL